MKKIILPLLIVLITVCGCKSHINDKVGADSIDENMEYRKMGNLEVGVIGISSCGFAKMDTTEAYGFMDSVLRKGINYIDLCGADTTTLNNIGYALQNRRNQIFIQGSIGNCWKDSLHKRIRNTKECLAELEEMLTRLGTSYLNIGMLENIDSKADWQKIVKGSYINFLKQLKDDGKINRIGLVCNNTETAYEALQSGIFEVLLLQVDPATDLLPGDFITEDSTGRLGEYDAENEIWYDYQIKDSSLIESIDSNRLRLYEYCKENKISIITTIMETDKDTTSPVTFSHMQQIDFALSRPGVISTLSKASNIKELADDLHFLGASYEEKHYKKALMNLVPADETAESSGQKSSK